MSRLPCAPWTFLVQSKACTCEWVMSHMPRMNESCHTSVWWMRHVTQTNESCHTYQWVMAPAWMCHVTRIIEAYHTYEWVLSHLSRALWAFLLQRTSRTSKWVMSHMPRTNESRHTYLRHLEHLFYEEKPTHVNESRQTSYEWVMSHYLGRLLFSEEKASLQCREAHICEWVMSLMPRVR